MNVVLVGNPNSGKTTLFNKLTGTNHHVGNWPGVTVEKKEGIFEHKGKKIKCVDLPGIYSIFPFSIEEKVSREYILENDIDVIVNIVNASNLERNLYLTLQLLELGKPVVLALNMMDAVRKKGISIDLDILEEKLSLKAVPISAIKNEGIEDLLDVLVSDKIVKNNFFINYGEDIEKKISIHEREYKDYNKRWIGIKIIENDDVIKKLVSDSFDNDYTNKITAKKYNYIDDLLDKVITYSGKKVTDWTSKIDSVVTNKYLGIPIFLFIMTCTFLLTFNIGNIFVDYLDYFFNDFLNVQLTSFLNILGANSTIKSLLIDGILGGVGGVLVFVPNIAILFLFISLLEDSGYMARAALIMDKWMRKIGLNGKSFIPMIMGFGCNVPAIMSTKTLQNEKDRLIAILINPFMSCGARLPVYALFASVFFSGYEALVTLSLYILGIVVAILMAFIFKKTLFKGEENPFIMELPEYNIPDYKSVAIHVWEKVRGYLINAGTIIFAASVFIWVILNYNFSGVATFDSSFGANIGRSLEGFFQPLGFGDWRAALALISGAVAKEIVVANMNILFDGDLTIVFNSLSAYSYMVFVLLYTPCVATIGIIKRETNSWKWMFFSIIYQLIIAWGVAFLIYQLGLLIFS